MAQPLVSKGKDRARAREIFWQTIVYVLLYASIVIRGAAYLLSQYLIIILAEWTLRSDVSHYLVVKLWFERARIGLALLVIIYVVWKSARATWLEITERS